MTRLLCPFDSVPIYNQPHLWSKQSNGIEATYRKRSPVVEKHIANVSDCGSLDAPCDLRVAWGSWLLVLISGVCLRRSADFRMGPSWRLARCLIEAQLQIKNLPVVDSWSTNTRFDTHSSRFSDIEWSGAMQLQIMQVFLMLRFAAMILRLRFSLEKRQICPRHEVEKNGCSIQFVVVYALYRGQKGYVFAWANT